MRVLKTIPKKDELPWECKTQLDAIKDAYKETIDSNLKIMGILLIVVGWFVSQENPLAMICEFKFLAYFGIASTIFGLLALAYLFDRIFKRADTAYWMLIESGVDRRLFEGYRVSRTMYWIGIFGQFTLLLGIVTVLYYKYISHVFDTCNRTRGTHSLPAILLSTMLCVPALAADPLEGRWLAIDPKSHVQAIIELQVHGENLEGKVVSIMQNGVPIDPICTKCKGNLKDAHVIGATFIWGLKKAGDRWVDGRVVDIRPNGWQGFVANCELDMIDGKAHIFGWPSFIRIIGHSDSWTRVPSDRTPAPSN